MPSVVSSAIFQPIVLPPLLTPPSGRLSAQCQYVIFVNGPIYSVSMAQSLFKSRSASPNPPLHLANAYKAALNAAKANGIRDMVRQRVHVTHILRRLCQSAARTCDVARDAETS